MSLYAFRACILLLAATWKSPEPVSVVFLLGPISIQTATREDELQQFYIPAAIEAYIGTLFRCDRLTPTVTVISTSCSNVGGGDGGVSGASNSKGDLRLAATQTFGPATTLDATAVAFKAGLAAAAAAAAAATAADQPDFGSNQKAGGTSSDDGMNDAVANDGEEQDVVSRTSISACAFRELTNVYSGEYTNGVVPNHVVAIFGLAVKGSSSSSSSSNTIDIKKTSGDNYDDLEDDEDAHDKQTNNQNAIRFRRPVELVEAMFGLIGQLDPTTRPQHLTMFYNASNVLDRTLIGTPECADTYADMTHFSKAYTLKCLIAGKAQGQDRSLQAKMLEQGIDARVVHAHHLHLESLHLSLQQGRQQQTLPAKYDTARGVIDRRRPLELHDYLAGAVALPPGCGAADKHMAKSNGQTRHRKTVPEADRHATASALIAAGKVQVVRNASTAWLLPAREWWANSAGAGSFKKNIVAGLNGRGSSGSSGSGSGDGKDSVMLSGVKVGEHSLLAGSRKMTIADADETAAGSAFFWSNRSTTSKNAVFTPGGFSVGEMSAADMMDAVLPSKHGTEPGECSAAEGCSSSSSTTTTPPLASKSTVRPLVSYFTPLPAALSSLPPPPPPPPAASTQVDGGAGAPVLAAPELSPFYNTAADEKLGKQFLWVSSAGVSTHTHFDQDHNIFVQLAGSKKITLFPPGAHETLYLFPRLHPLWHKSKVPAGIAVNVGSSNGGDGGDGGGDGGGGGDGSGRSDATDGVSFPGYAAALEAAQVVVLHPGDLLYIPPYTFHHVETLEGSVSLATLSHENTAKEAMTVVYKLDHKFDRLQDPRGKVYALRLFLDMMVHELVGNAPGETLKFFSVVLNTRWKGMKVAPAKTNVNTNANANANGGQKDQQEHLDRGQAEDEMNQQPEQPPTLLCEAHRIPVAQHVYGKQHLLLLLLPRTGFHPPAPRGH